MQLDQARITICERSWLDNLDLALHVIRIHAAALAASALAGILPMALLNYALLNRLHTRRFPDDMSPSAFGFAVLLVMIEAPLATAPLTLYLGQALFVERPKAARIARDFLACLPQLVVLQVLVRGLLIVPVLTWVVPYGIWPYLNEVILLERNPLFGRRDQVSTLKRNSNLHRNNGGDFLLRALGAMCLAPLLILALWVTQRFLLDTLFGFHEGWGAQAAAFQGVLWLVVVYFAVARFLSYLDQRIRNEGWEVELFLRAERERLARHAV
jgi:hypothetical protein